MFCENLINQSENIFYLHGEEILISAKPKIRPNQLTSGNYTLELADQLSETELRQSLPVKGLDTTQIYPSLHQAIAMAHLHGKNSFHEPPYRGSKIFYKPIWAVRFIGDAKTLKFESQSPPAAEDDGVKETFAVVEKKTVMPLKAIVAYRRKSSFFYQLYQPVDYIKTDPNKKTLSVVDSNSQNDARSCVIL